MTAEKQYWKKTAHGLVPSNEKALKLYERLKDDDEIWGNLTGMRNPKFHKKWFALAAFAFENWEPVDPYCVVGVELIEHEFGDMADLITREAVGVMSEDTFRRIISHLKALQDKVIGVWPVHASDHPSKSFDVFRKDLTIQAGYYEQVFRLDGTFTMEAKSIAPGSMNNDTFEEFYSKTIDVVLAKILPKYSAHDLNSTVNRILGFCG